MATMNISARLRSDFLSSSKSLMPSARPTPMIGPMIGEMSIAPMITAAELTFRPSEAIHRGEDQHPEVDAAELHALRDGGHDLVALRLVLVEAETALHKFAQLPEPRRKRTFYLLCIVCTVLFHQCVSI